MQACRDLICPQHSDLQVHRDLPLSAFLTDNQIQITFCNYIIKQCNLFSFSSPVTDWVANASTSLTGIFPYSQLSYSQHSDSYRQTTLSSFIWSCVRKKLAGLDDVEACKTLHAAIPWWRYRHSCKTIRFFFKLGKMNAYPAVAVLLLVTMTCTQYTHKLYLHTQLPEH